MRSTLRCVALAAIAATALVGCGGHGASNAIANKRPVDVVLASGQAAEAGSLRFDLDAKIGIDTSKLTGLPAGAAAGLGLVGNGLTFTGHADVENPQRVHLVLDMKAPVNQQITAVTYDGKSYVSLDGTNFYEADVKQATSGIDASQLLKVLGQVGAVKDLGQAQQDGLTVEHYQATLDPAQVLKLFEQQAGGNSSAQGLGAFFQQLFSFSGGTVEDYVDSATGKIDRLGVTFGIAIDFDKLKGAFSGLGGSQGGSSLSQAPGGQMSITITANLHLFDYGASIKVTKPANISPGAPKLGTGGLFGLT